MNSVHVELAVCNYVSERNVVNVMNEIVIVRSELLHHTSA